MAIIGGAGNPVGGSFTGAAEALEVIGKNHVYAYSGVVNDPGGSASAVTTMFDFTTGNYYCIVSLDLITDVKAGENVYIELLLNGVIVYQGVWDEEPAKANARPLVTFLIPSYTEVLFKWGSSSNKNATAVLTGRRYHE